MRAIHRDILAEEHKLSERQAISLGHVLEHGALTIQELEAWCEGVNRRTLQRDLKDMVENGPDSGELGQAHDDRDVFQASDRRAAHDRHSQPLNPA